MVGSSRKRLWRKNADLLFFASPWSPPGWMKSTGTMIGGYLLPPWYPAYAKYFVKFIQAYVAEGIPIHAVTLLDEKGKPNNGPFQASRTIITVDAKTGKTKEHFDFFLYGQFMKFIQRGAVRIESTPGTRTLANVAFRNPNGTILLVVVNAENREQTLTVTCAGQAAVAGLAGKSVATFVW